MSEVFGPVNSTFSRFCIHRAESPIVAASGCPSTSFSPAPSAAVSRFRASKILRLGLKHAWLFLNTLDSTAAVRPLVALYVSEHNEKIPRALLGGRTPDEVYFGREENLLERLSEQRRKAQAARSAANRAASCHRCESPRAGPAVRNVARIRARRKPARNCS